MDNKKSMRTASEANGFERIGTFWCPCGSADAFLSGAYEVVAGTATRLEPPGKLKGSK